MTRFTGRHTGPTEGAVGPLPGRPATASVVNEVSAASLHRVVVNDEAYISEKRIIASLAAIYLRDDGKLPVAILCDDYLDPSGRLLGKVRDEAVRLGDA